jgi:hypothetical protein
MRVPAWKQQTAIADEFGQSFSEVIRDYRRDGYEWKTIAGSLEIPYSALRRWVKELELEDGVRNGASHKSFIPQRAKELGYPSIQAMIVEYRGNGKMLKELAADIGCHASKLYVYMPEDVKGLWVLDPSQRKNNNVYKRKKTKGLWALDRYGTNRTNSTGT